MSRRRVSSGPSRGLGRRRGPPRDIDLRQAGEVGETLDRMPVAVPRPEVHLAEAASHPEDVIDDADALNERRPVEPRDESHARDHVPDRDVHRCLALVLDADHLLGGHVLAGNDCLEPTERRRGVGILIPQPLEELDARRRRERRGSQATERGAGRLRAVRPETEQTVGELVGPLPRRPRPDDLFGDPAKVLHQEDPEADGDRPQLSDRQRVHFLVGPDHPAEGLRLEQAVGVRDVRPRKAEHARIACEVTLSQFRQLVVVVGRQVVSDLSELLVDDREVVDEPLGGRRDRPFLGDRPSQRAVRLDQDPAVLGDARPDRVATSRLVGHALGTGQAPGMVLQPLHAEELGEDRLVEGGRPADPRPDPAGRISQRIGDGHGRLPTGRLTTSSYVATS